MKTKIKRHSRSVISVVLAVCMLISCMTVGLIATDAAKISEEQNVTGAVVQNDDNTGAVVGDELTGAGLYLLYGTSNKPSDLHDIGATISQVGTTYTIDLPTGIAFNTGTDYYFALSSSKDRTGIFFSRGTYGSTSISVSKDNSNTFSSAAEQTYNQPDDGNGTSYSYRFARVSFSQNVNTSSTGITITVDSSARSYLFEATSTVNYTVTVQSGANGSVKAGSTTVNPNGTASVSSNPTGISLTATPSTGYVFDRWEVTGSGASVDNPTSRSTTLKATASGGTVTAAFKQAATTKKTIYYNNGTTKWTTPYAFAWTEGVANYLGEWPGSAMTLHKGNIWKIEVSTDAEKIIFSGKGANQTADQTIPTGENDYYNNGTWTKYTESTSDNKYTAALGSSITGNPNLYSNINATFYDYYTDNECGHQWYTDINAADDGWIGITISGKDDQRRRPYDTLNTSLRQYASNNSTTYPLYFGSFLDWGNIDVDNTNPVGYHFNQLVNDSNHFGTGNNDTALTGLSGKTLENDNIHYFKKNATNDNGAPMVLFDEDWLTSRGSGYTYQGALATIINSNFPVRKSTKETYNVTNVYLNIGKWSDDTTNVRYAAYFFKSSDANDYIWRDMTSSGSYFTCEIPHGYDKVIFCRMKGDQLANNWDNKKNQTGNLSVPTDTKNVLYTVDTWDNSGDNHWSQGTGITVNSGTIDYYEFNSTGGNDNIYFDDLTGGSPVMQYGEGTGYAVKNGYNKGYSFLPFDRYDTNYTNDSALKGYGKDLGFGMRLDIDFTLGREGKINGVDQQFNFSGDDDLWVFVDGNLVLDLGGDHSMTTASINFASKSVDVTKSTAIDASISRNDDFEIDNDNPNKIHKMTLFYMERGMHESNLKFGFSFTPVGNEFLTEKQVTNRNVNAGLKDAAMAVAQDDSFTFTHSTSNEVGGTYTASARMSYHYNDTENRDTTDSGTFDLKHGDTADFLDQFTKNQYFKIIETPASDNKLRYSQNLLVTDMVTNATIQAQTDGSYKFLTTKAGATDLDATRIEAFFTNIIDTQTLTVTKRIPTYYDPDTNFTVKVEVALDGTNFHTYPLAYTKKGVADTMPDAGTVTLKRNESIVIAGVPKNAKIRVTEINMPSNYAFGSYRVTDASNTVVSASDVPNGCTFTLLADDTVTLNNSPYRYSIIYNYESRLYGNQSYSVSGVLTTEDAANVNPQTSLKTEFLKKHAPYEDNFKKTQTLDFDHPVSNTYSGGIYSAELNFELGTFTKPKAVINMPYAHAGESQSFAPTATDGKIVKATVPDEPVTADEYLGHFKANGEYIDAPLEIYDGGNKQNFQYWTLSTLVAGGKGEFVANNYSTKLNYTAYEDYYIEAVYNSNPRPSISTQETNTTITFLEDSRNQWNNGGGGSSKDLPEGWLDHGDQIYVDFDLAFYDGGKLLNDTTANPGITTGVVLQKAGDLQEDGTSYHYNDETYRTQIESLKNQENPAAVKAFISNNTQPTGAPCVNLNVLPKDLDNKNRIEFFYGLSNKSIKTGNATSIKTYIYRAYSYINVNGNITLSEKPVYFNVYETATKGYVG